MGINRRIVALNFGLFLMLVFMAAAVPSGRFVLVVTDPRLGPGGGLSAIDAAGGTFVSEGRFAWMNVAYSEEKDFPGRLMRAGAMLVLNHRFAVGCSKDLS